MTPRNADDPPRDPRRALSPGPARRLPALLRPRARAGLRRQPRVGALLLPLLPRAEVDAVEARSRPPQNRAAMAARIETGETGGLSRLRRRRGRRLAQRAALPQAAARLRPARRRAAAAATCRRTQAAAIVCFVIAPAWRRRGVARALLAGALGVVRRARHPRRRRLSVQGRARTATPDRSLPRPGVAVRGGGLRCCARPRLTVMRRRLVAPDLTRRRPQLAGAESRRPVRRVRPPPPRTLPLAAAALPRRALRGCRSPTRACSRSRRGSRRARARRSSCSRRGRRAGRGSTSLANVLAYVPFGFFVALIAAARPSPRARGCSVAVARAPRCRSHWRRCRCSCRRATPASIDLLANTAGSLSARAASPRWRSGSSTRLREAIRDRRERWFLPRTDRRPGPRAARHLARRAGQSRHSAVRHDVRRRRRRQAGLAASVAAAPDVAGGADRGRAQRAAGAGRRPLRRAAGARAPLRRRRGVAADRRRAADQGHRGGAAAEAGGVGALAVAGRVRRRSPSARWRCRWSIFLPRPAQVAICAIALLSSLLSTLLAPELLLARPPLSLFNWGYGHLLNFNGLTRTRADALADRGKRVPVRARRTAATGDEAR